MEQQRGATYKGVFEVEDLGIKNFQFSPISESVASYSVKTIHYILGVPVYGCANW